jgi:hypothetical protein
MPEPDAGNDIDVLRRLEQALSALERSFAALGADERISQDSRARAAEAASAIRDARGGGPVTDQEQRRLQSQIRALQSEVRELEQVVGRIYGALEEEERPKGT